MIFQGERRGYRPEHCGRAGWPFFRILLNWIVAVVLLAMVCTTPARANEVGLSQVGKGIPAIVQIYDPGCNDCKSLRRATLQALDSFSNKQLVYAVADITTGAGDAYAKRYKQETVTLMLLDPKGKPVKIIKGRKSPNTLRKLFASHVGTYQ